MNTFVKAVLLALWLPGGVQAQSGLQLAFVSLDQATKQVRQNSSLRILGAKTEVIDGKEVHIIKVLTKDGRVQHVRVDAETGQMMGRGH